MQSSANLNTLEDADRKFLLAAARQSICRAVGKHPGSAATSDHASAKVHEYRACFVTLLTDGCLHGCVGNVSPDRPLLQAVISNSVKASLHDPRFPALRPEDIDHTTIEISVLSTITALPRMTAAELLATIDRGTGVLLRKGDRVATFLPQVWDQFPDKTQFLNELSRKGGWGRDAWQDADASISVYSVDKFSDDTDVAS